MLITKCDRCKREIAPVIQADNGAFRELALSISKALGLANHNYRIADADLGIYLDLCDKCKQSLNTWLKNPTKNYVVAQDLKADDKGEAKKDEQ